MPRRLTENDILRIAELWHAGYGKDRIEAMTGITRNTVKAVVRCETRKAKLLLKKPLSDGRRRPRARLVNWEGVAR